MRKFLGKCVMGILMLFVCLGIKHETTSADVIFVPDDKFEQQNRDDCRYEGRSYTADGESGDVASYENPKSDNVIETLPNGRQIFIYMIYRDPINEERWGLYSELYKQAWVPMSKLKVVYDDISFWEEHEKEFVPYNGEMEQYLFSLPTTLYQYPGSEKTTRTLKKGFVDPNVKLNQFLVPEAIYIDSDGNKWGYVSKYCWGYCKGWYCISKSGAAVQGSDTKEDDNSPVYKGDVDGDGAVSLYDTNWILKAALNMCNFSEGQKTVADVDADSSVTLNDAKSALKIALKIE